MRAKQQPAPSHYPWLAPGTALLRCVHAKRSYEKPETEKKSKGFWLLAVLVDHGELLWSTRLRRSAA